MEAFILLSTDYVGAKLSQANVCRNSQEPCSSLLPGLGSGLCYVIRLAPLALQGVYSLCGRGHQAEFMSCAGIGCEEAAGDEFYGSKLT